ncbi:protein of unknown function [Nitrospira defluvii]|uniref:Uncharacterized protein n=1 Tax=Nitrospira defluvii TaxID=330214 RepID=D8PA60_9BACT|nr:protein of unknown function [Nitrospira defluvii]
MKVAEANLLRLRTSTRQLKPHADGKLSNESVAIGYGYDLLDRGKTVQQIKDDLNAVGVTLTRHDETVAHGLPKWFDYHHEGLFSPTGKAKCLYVSHC